MIYTIIYVDGADSFNPCYSGNGFGSGGGVADGVIIHHVSILVIVEMGLVDMALNIPIDITAMFQSLL